MGMYVFKKAVLQELLLKRFPKVRYYWSHLCASECYFLCVDTLCVEFVVGDGLGASEGCGGGLNRLIINRGGTFCDVVRCGNC